MLPWLLEISPTAKLAAQSASKYADHVGIISQTLDVRFLRGANKIKKVCSERLRIMNALRSHVSQSCFQVFGIGSSIKCSLLLYPKNLDTYRWSSRTVDPCKVYGLDDKERFLERLLVRKECKNGFKALAIVGMTGVGKTTLCQLMFNNKKVKEYFLPRIWVCLSKQPEDDEDKRKEAVKRMLMCLGVEDDIIEKAGEDQNLGLQRLMFALRLQLMGKKYLIVLDDAWNSDKCFEDLYSESTQDENSYGQLAYGLPKGHGGTVVITTRSEEIAKKMVGEENLHQLPILKDRESCWKIFKDSVEKGGTKFPQELMPLKDLIVDKCAGLPLVAKMMGEIMYQKLLENPIQNQIEQSQNQQQSSAQQSAV